jgi:hypothetical protein
VARDWEGLVHETITRNAGLVSLWQAADYCGPRESGAGIDVHLGGIGGEIARSYYLDPRGIVAVRSLRRLQQAMAPPRAAPAGSILRDEAYATANAYVCGSLSDLVEMGFQPRDAATAYYAFERVRRWGGAQAGKYRGRIDPYLPLTTRFWLRAAFALRPHERALAPLHYRILEHVDPGLLELPLTGSSWFPQHARREYARWIMALALGKVHPRLRDLLGPLSPSVAGEIPALDQLTWVEDQRAWLADFCLAHGSSEVWRLVDRSRFEAVVSRSADPGERRRHAARIFHVATILGAENPAP